MKLHDLSIAQRITFAFGLVIMLVLVASGSGLFFDRTITQNIETTNSAIDELNSAYGLELTWDDVVASTDYMLLTRQTSLIESRVAAELDAFNSELTSLQNMRLGSTPAAAEENAELIDGLTLLAEDLTANVNSLIALAQDGSWTRAQALRHTELASLQRRFSETLAILQSNIQEDVERTAVAAVEVQSTTRTAWVVLSVAAVLVGTVAAVWTARSIVRPVNLLANAARAIQQGNYEQRVEVGNVHDELAVMEEAFNAMSAKISHSISDLEHHVEALETSNKERERLITELKDALLFKDQFLATMSHELRTPLNAMLGYAALIQDEQNVDEDVLHMVQRIESNSNRLLSLINDVLNIARINANRVEIVARPIELRTMVHDWYEDFKHQADEKGLRFDLEIDPILPRTIIGDEERLTQITANLLHNALKFTSKGFIALRVFRDNNRDEWSIAVADSGQGIPETWQHLIFDEFRQVDGGSKRKHGGAGLGLSIVKKLCLLMGGSVSVSSKLEVGSTFTVTLPLMTTAESAASPSSKAQSVEEEVADVAGVAAT